MNLARFSVDRPVTTAVVYLVVILFGILSFLRIPIDLLPDVTFPTLNVQIDYTGVGPEEIERLITIPVEEAASTVPGVEEITASSREGQSRVTIQFAWGTDLSAATDDLRSNLERIRSRLPGDASEPSLRKFDPSQMPILTLGLEGRLDSRELRRLAENEIKNRLERVPGVAQVSSMGGQLREIQVYLLKERAQALGVTLERMATALREDNQNVPAGTLEQGAEDILLRTFGELRTPEDIGRVVVLARSGQPIRVSDVAQVVDGVVDENTIVRLNGNPAVMVQVSRRSGANTVEVADRVKEEAAEISAEMAAVDLVPVFDQSLYIRQAIENLRDSAILGAILTILVLLLSLRSLRGTLIVALAIPVSLLATFWLMFASGISLNLVSFGGLALGIGMMVDSAVVTFENIFQHHERGADPRRAAIDGTGEVASAVVAGALTTMVVFLPLTFVTGLTGVLLKQLALVVSFSNLCTLAGALTLVPVLAAALLPGTAPRRNLVVRVLESSQVVLDRAYVGILHSTLRARLPLSGVLAILLGVTLAVAPRIDRELLPTVDEGQINSNMSGAVGNRLSLTLEATLAVERAILRDVPEVQTLLATAGGTVFRGGSPHEASFRLQLVPRDQRKRSDRQIADQIRKILEATPGFEGFARTQSGLFIFRRLSRGGDDLELEVRGEDLEASMAVAKQLEAHASETLGLSRAEIEPGEGRPEVIIVMDRERASLLGISLADAARVLEDHLRGAVPTFLRTGSEEIDVRLWLHPDDRSTLDSVLTVPVPTAAGESVPLSAIARLERRTGPEQIDREEKERVIRVTAPRDERPLVELIDEVQPYLRSLPLPAGTTVRVGGDHEELDKAFRELTLGLLMAIVLVYLVMAAQFENLVWPLVIMVAIPFSGIGVVWMLLLTATTLNVQSFIGLIVLAGIAVNNAIVLVEYTRLLQHRGMPVEEAVLEAGRTRLRPVLITTVTTVLAMVPIALGIGQGAEVQAPMARVVIGGLTVGTLITLVVIPALHLTIEESEPGSLPGRPVKESEPGSLPGNRDR